MGVAEERDRLVAALGGFPQHDGFSVACIAGIDAETVVRLLEAELVEVTDEQAEYWWENPFDGYEDTIGVTTVPGGCVLVQPWGYDARNSKMLDRLTVGAVAYAMYANPKSGDQGQIHRDGEVVGWDLHPGGGPYEDDDDATALLAELYSGEPVAFCCAYAGLRPTDNRAFKTPDLWLRRS
ncbi:hypothetical protein LFM09_17260 [Lentzea alba]|uniref:hypothetical protein n=1 Tax=Lentzea alba TaxID=2714351 RepID=UPI0039BFDEF6